MTAPTPEQRAAWRRDAVLSDAPTEDCDARILALLDALKEAEQERGKWQRRAEREHTDHGKCDEIKERAVATLARVVALAAKAEAWRLTASERHGTPGAAVIKAGDLLAALNGDGA